MKINKPKISMRKNSVIYSVDVESSFGRKKLWFSMQSCFSELLTNSSDAPLLALLIPAMANGEDIYIDGSISEKLFYNLSRQYQCLLRLVIPSVKPIKIYPNELLTNFSNQKGGVATGLSGGIDSYCTLGDHYFFDVTPSYKLTHLLFNNVGSHGVGREELFKIRSTEVKKIADCIGLPLITTNSNMDSFYSEKLGFPQTHTPRNVAVSLLLQGGISKFLYSSGVRFLDQFVGESKYMGYSDSIALPLLSTEKIEAISVGGEYTRVEKTLRVAKIPISYETLDVCVRGDRNEKNERNCSYCEKCMRTLLTLEISGDIERYKDSFNLNTYRRLKSKYIADEVLKKSDPFVKEIKQFAKSKNFKFPVISSIYALFVVRFLRSARSMLIKKRIGKLDIVDKSIITALTLLKTWGTFPKNWFK